MPKGKSQKSGNGKANRHQIRFPITRETATFEKAVEEVRCVVLARAGVSTKRISEILRISKSKVQYRIWKGEAIGARARFRNGESWETEVAVRAIQRKVIQEISETVTPKYL
jgi:hypothetical protein